MRVLIIEDDKDVATFNMAGLEQAGHMAELPAATWLHFLAWMVIGLVIYFAYTRHHSQLVGTTN